MEIDFFLINPDHRKKIEKKKNVLVPIKMRKGYCTWK